MLTENTIKSVEYWNQQFGLYPMLIQPKKFPNKYLMLNGGNKDFCLLTKYTDYGKDIFFSESWSTNTKNFLVINDNTIYVYNWINNKIEDYALEDLDKKQDRFYSYLSSQSYKHLMM